MGAGRSDTRSGLACGQPVGHGAHKACCQGDFKRQGEAAAHLMNVFSLEQHSMIMVASSISWPSGMPCRGGGGVAG